MEHSDGDGLSIVTRMRRDMLHSLAASRLYRHTLLGRVPLGIEVKLAQAWPGDPRRGAAIAAGEIEFAGNLTRNPSPRWFPAAAGEEWLACWHGFDWISDLIAAGAAARDVARELVQSWLSEEIGCRSVAWRSDVLATRLFAWLSHFEEIVGGGQEPALKRAVLASLAAQNRHLARIAAWELDGPAKLRALKGLIAGTVALGGSAARLARALRWLEREMPAQILPDGGHRTRSPSVQLKILQDLVDIREVLRAAKTETPGALEDAIARAAPMLRLFRHGDRRLALFNDSLEEDGILLDLVLTRSETKGRSSTHAPDSGFERLQADKSLVLVDTGRRPPPGFDMHAHAGALSFEMSHGRDRVIVNCGGYRGPKSSWSRVARASAAHSVLVVADTNSAEIRDDGVLNRAPTTVSCERAEHEGQQWISATHDGYRERFGLIYTRELFLAASGEDLRGEERLSGRPGAEFAVRFHLHPSVQASLVDDESAALLRLPSGARWRLRAAGAEMSLGESIYLGSGEARKTQQVVLSGTAAAGGTNVRWALRCEHDEAACD
ncbi:MAG TPA: heparinase II/III family protein [Stellaceae bacterium]|nr:heparinase II/III family protein [Stellaceae bacterium]